MGSNTDSKFPCGKELFQAHLERIADFVHPGAGVWWHVENNVVIFHDGDSHPDFREEGPLLMSYENTNLNELPTHLNKIWNQCLKNSNILQDLLREIKIYDNEGYFQTNIHVTGNILLTVRNTFNLFPC